MDVSKTKSSFYRRLYVADLIDCQLASSVPELEKVTGMPRRTAQELDDSPSRATADHRRGAPSRGAPSDHQESHAVHVAGSSRHR